jgi:two-component system NtrC family sensor kinase
MLVLTVISGPDKGKRFVVNEPQLIGRSSEALRTNDPTISRRHAELTPDGGRWYIRDLESSNGTFVNGSQIADRTEVTPGDHIRTGATLFVCGKTDPTPSDRGRIEVVQPDELDARVDKTRAAGDASVLLPSTDQEHAALEQLRVIYRLTQLTTQVFDQQSLLEKVMDLVFEEFKPDRGFILLFDTGKKGGQPAVVRHRTGNGGPEGGKISVSRTVIQHVIQEKEGVLSSKVTPTGGEREGEAPIIRSAICVPIQFHNHVFGVIHIDVDIAAATYSEPQLALLTAIGQHSGLALQNAEMYRAQIQTERLAAVGETIASLSHSIKNILQGLRGGADVLEMGLKKEDFQLSRGGWDVLSRNLERIYTLTMNMLAFTKRTPLEMELTKPIPVLRDCIELIKPQCDRKGVKLTIEPDQDMPPIRWIRTRCTRR